MEKITQPLHDEHVHEQARHLEKQRQQSKMIELPAVATIPPEDSLVKYLSVPLQEARRAGETELAVNCGQLKLTFNTATGNITEFDIPSAQDDHVDVDLMRKRTQEKLTEFFASQSLQTENIPGPKQALTEGEQYAMISGNFNTDFVVIDDYKDHRGKGLGTYPGFSDNVTAAGMRDSDQNRGPEPGAVNQARRLTNKEVLYGKYKGEEGYMVDKRFFYPTNRIESDHPDRTEERRYEDFKSLLRSQLDALSETDRQDVKTAIKAGDLDFKAIFFGGPMHREISRSPLRTSAVQNFETAVKSIFDGLGEESKKALREKLTHQDIANSI